VYGVDLWLLSDVGAIDRCCINGKAVGSECNGTVHDTVPVTVRKSRPRVSEAASYLGGPGVLPSLFRHSSQHLISTSFEYIHEDICRREFFLKDNANSPRARLHAAFSLSPAANKYDTISTI
jgi:hypothetical protein